MTLTVGSLFSGIGGLDLGLERAGMEVIWQSEIDPYACKVLSKHWPEVVNHGNIKEIKWGDVVRPNIICGGYPCQPFSTAGKRNGTDDPRHLWPWVREAISVLRPDYAILENVRGHVSLGLDIVLREMAVIGYDAEWQIVSAASVGAPHRRDRVIIVAYPANKFSDERGRSDNPRTSRERQALQKPTRRSNSPSTNPVRELANTDSIGHLHGQTQVFTADRWLNALSLIGSSRPDVANPDGATSQQVSDASRERSGRLGPLGQSGEPLQQQRDHPRREDGHAGRQWWTVEPDVGRVAHGIPARVDRLRGLGNAVVPHVAELIGRMIMDYTDKEEA